MNAQHPSTEAEKDTLISIVERTFAQGALNQLNIKEMEKGFHPEFAILIGKGSEIFKLPLSNWIELVRQYKNDPEKVRSGVRDLDYSIEVLDLTDNIAVVKTQYFKNKELVITDYLSYMQFKGTWKAVSKISKDHISNPLNLDL